jgi:hypothetical protein
VHAPIRPAPDHSNPTEARRTRSETIQTSTYVNVPPMSNQQATLDLIWSALRKTRRPSELLLRKEVIQPHLPVRLPCYDLVLITDPTFDGSLHKG